MASGSQHCPGSLGNLCSLSLWLLLLGVDCSELERKEEEKGEIPDYTKRQERLHAPHQIRLCEGELVIQVLLTHFVSICEISTLSHDHSYSNLHKGTIHEVHKCVCTFHFCPK